MIVQATLPVFCAESITQTMSTSRLSTAVHELEQALAALDETMQAAAQKLQDRQQPPTEATPSVGGDLVPAKQVREELVAVQQMVSSAAELIALARTADSPNTDGSATDGQEMH